MAEAGRAARQRAVAVLLAAGGTPLLVIGLASVNRSDRVYWTFPALAVGLLAVGMGQAARRRAVPPSLVAGLVLLLITAAWYYAGYIPYGYTEYGLTLGGLSGSIGVAGCTAAWRWLRAGGSRWIGSPGWAGGCFNLGGAALCLVAVTGWDASDADWATLRYLILAFLCMFLGCLLMVLGAAAMAVCLRRSARVRSQCVRSSTVRPAGVR
jgi:hypothetical protein